MENYFKTCFADDPRISLAEYLDFFIAKLMPGDPFTGMITPQTSPAQIEALRIKVESMIRGIYNTGTGSSAWSMET